MKGKIIVTGATSFIGKQLIKYLLEKKYKVYAIVRTNSDKLEFLPKSADLISISLDMENYHNLSLKIHEQCDVFYSLAWNGTRGQERNDFEMQQKNYEYSMNSIEEAAKLGCKIIISAGSQAEYGNINGKINEISSCNPNTEYGRFKLKFYDEAFDFCKKKGIRFKEPRFFSLYGVDDYDGTMIISILKNMLANIKCELTECVQLWDFLYISDAIKGLVYLIEKECSDGIYNFGSGDTRELKTFIMEMYEITQSKSELLFGKIPYPSTGMVSIYPSIEKLQSETGWKPNVTFQEGIKRVINYLKLELN